MKKIYVLTAAFLLLFLSAGLSMAVPNETHLLSPEKQKAFLIRLEGNLKASRTIRANFTQEKRLPLFKDALVSHGTFAFSAPDRLRWEITKPFHSLLIMNGRTLGKYDFPDGQNPHRIKFPAADAFIVVLDQIADLHQGKFSEQEKNYDIEVYQGEKSFMKLIPKNAKMKKVIPEIEIGFSKALNSVESVVIRERGGDSTRIVFENSRLQSELPDGLFSVQ
jgi:outer membrane lipoprotein-sorting protein